MLFNTHSHVDSSRQFQADRGEVMARAREHGVSRIAVIGFKPDVIPTTLAFLEQYPEAVAAVGVHPTDALEWGSPAEEAVRRAFEHARVRAIGEIGLDYYWKDRAPFDHQQLVFRLQIRLARELRVPVVIHDRDAHDDVIRILEEEHAEDVGGIMHCYSGDWAMAERCLNLGFYIGVGGTITYKSSSVIQDVVRRMPIDQLVLETDDPYLAPVPFRGKRNEPGYVRYVAEFVAGLREASIDEIADLTYRNGCRAFELEV